MNENNVRTDTNTNAGASVELFTYDSEAPGVVALARPGGSPLGSVGALGTEAGCETCGMAARAGTGRGPS